MFGSQQRVFKKQNNNNNNFFKNIKEIEEIALEYIKRKPFSFLWPAPVEQKTPKTPKFQSFILSIRMQAQQNNNCDKKVTAAF